MKGETKSRSINCARYNSFIISQQDLLGPGIGYKIPSRLKGEMHNERKSLLKHGPSFI